MNGMTGERCDTFSPVTALCSRLLFQLKTCTESKFGIDLEFSTLVGRFLIENNTFKPTPDTL